MLVKAFLTVRDADSPRMEQVRLCTPVWKSPKVAPGASFTLQISRSHCPSGPSVAGDENVGVEQTTPALIY